MSCIRRLISSRPFTRKLVDVMLVTGRSSGLFPGSTPSHSWRNSGTKIEQACETYSYGDSAGFTPASLLIPSRHERGGNQFRGKCNKPDGFRLIVNRQKFIHAARLSNNVVELDCQPESHRAGSRLSKADSLHLASHTSLIQGHWKACETL